MAASATLALNAGAWVRRARLVMVAPDPRHTRRSQAETPLIDLSEFGQPALVKVTEDRPHRQNAVNGSSLKLCVVHHPNMPNVTHYRRLAEEYNFKAQRATDPLYA